MWAYWRKQSMAVYFHPLSLNLYLILFRDAGAAGTYLSGHQTRHTGQNSSISLEMHTIHSHGQFEFPVDLIFMRRTCKLHIERPRNGNQTQDLLIMSANDYAMCGCITIIVSFLPGSGCMLEVAKDLGLSVIWVWIGFAYTYFPEGVRQISIREIALSYFVTFYGCMAHPYYFSDCHKSLLLSIFPVKTYFLLSLEKVCAAAECVALKHQHCDSCAGGTDHRAIDALSPCFYVACLRGTLVHNEPLNMTQNEGIRSPSFITLHLKCVYSICDQTTATLSQTN